MDDVLLIAEILGCLVLVPAGIALLGARARRRRIPGSVFSLFEELYDPRSHTVQIEIQVQAERTDPAPAPGDPPARRPPAPGGRIEPMPSSERDS